MERELNLKEKLQNIPHPIRTEIIKKLDIAVICEELKKVEKLQRTIPEGMHEGVEVFWPYNTIFKITYFDDRTYSPERVFAPTKTLRLNYFDCLDIIEMKVSLLEEIVEEANR